MKIKVGFQYKMSSVSLLNQMFAAKTFAEESIQVQKEGFQEYGVMADWEGQCFRTVDPQYEARQLDVFYTMYQKVELCFVIHEFNQFKNKMVLFTAILLSMNFPLHYG